MGTLISAATQRLGGYFGISKPTPPPASPTDGKVAQVMQSVLDAKKAHLQKALDNKWDRYNPVFIGGDLFTVGYLSFQGIQAFTPSLSGVAAVGAATLGCGVVAGAIFMGVGIVSLKEAIQAFKNGDKILGSRLLLDFITCIAVGTVMILTALALQVTVLGGIGAFFATNPWFLPVLFFIITIPLLFELSYRIKNIAAADDLGSQLKFDKLETLLKREKPNWDQIESLYENYMNPFNLKPLEKMNKKGQIEMLSRKMEDLQADMGATAAVEVFTLLTLIKQKNQKEALQQLLVAKKAIAEWNRSLCIRMFQQILYIVGFGVSMVALAPKMNANLLNGTQSFFLVGANLIPLYMDTFWPFKRNTPIVVPQVELKEIASTQSKSVRIKV